MNQISKKVFLIGLLSIIAGNSIALPVRFYGGLVAWGDSCNNNGYESCGLPVIGMTALTNAIVQLSAVFIGSYLIKRRLGPSYKHNRSTALKLAFGIVILAVLKVLLHNHVGRNEQLINLGISAVIFLGYPLYLVFESKKITTGN